MAEKQLKWTRKKKCLLVFIHGFMGSEDSFKEFPKHLIQLLERDYGKSEIDSAGFTYDTKGNNQRQVQKLMDWLILHGSTGRYESVILCAHSMGGLLAADAYRHLYRVQPVVNETQSWWSKAAGGVTSYFSYAPVEKNHTPDDMRFLVNIIAIFSFDSPFYGLHNNVVTKTGVMKAKEIAQDLPKILPNNLTAPAIAAIPDHFMVPTPVKDLHLPVSTKWVKTTAVGMMGVTLDDFQVDPNKKSTISIPKNINEQLPQVNKKDQVIDETKITDSSEWPLWAKSAVGLTAVASATLSIAAAFPPLAAGMAIQTLDQIQSYASFLNPLVTSQQECHERVQILVHEHHETKRIHFIGFFNGLPDSVQETTDTETIQLRHFCIPPPHHVSHAFKIIPSPLKDEIDAHMNMFDLDWLGPDHYWWFVNMVAKHVHEALDSKQ
ncbi:hypothetical protein HDV04_006306 [Boothiomyces sp. JEL0838]|nr:hypothetical protein HDV04_006306 [Boothiomyces sp. JEL0838]